MTSLNAGACLCAAENDDDDNKAVDVSQPEAVAVEERT